MAQVSAHPPHQPFALPRGLRMGLGQGISISGTSYLEFVVPGIIALTAMTASFNGAGVRLNTDRIYFRSFDECLMAPISSLSLLLGKASIGVVRGLASSITFLAVALLIVPEFHVSTLFLVILVITCFTFAFLGVLVALLANTHEDMATFSSLILLPMTFLGGTFFSVSQVPTALKIALYALPLTHSSMCLRAAALGQPVPLGSLLATACFMMMFSIGSMIVLRKISL
ncbi:MAG: ABC transporter permease [Methanotrichaceae archaeon]|nr:ABC transporter permease [Methanotrichaceae archaeon]